MEAGACPLPHWRASKCVMPGSTMSETATVATTSDEVTSH
jgi:hypothetical protein